MRNRLKQFFKIILLRIKKTTKRDNKSTVIMVFTAFIIANMIATMTAIGVPTGPTLKNRVLDILLATGVNSVGFILFLAIFSIILSLIFIPLPRLLTSAAIYNGVLHGIVLDQAKSGTNFSIFIGVITTIFTVVIGLLIIWLLKNKVVQWIAISLLAIGGIIVVILNISNGNVVDVASDGKGHPANHGDYDTTFFTYGSGTDLHREQFAEKVTERTTPVDASHFITRWSDKREDFWGFQPESFPINGRVWMPEGEGKFPVILMVHGNHTMEYFSTDGYDYLGELLASHGFTFISVDEDYVNYSNIVGQPNDNYELRAWLLLKHLVQLKELNNTEKSHFYQKINFNNVALAGHSRGGQAAAMAADYEKFFDDPILLTQLNDIHIKAVAAVSPTEKLVDSKRATLDDIAYMVLHGSQDSDVYDFRGNKQFHRTNLSENSNLFKSAVYIENANHVHFNTSWGSSDLSLPRGIFLHRSSVMNKHEQQLIAQAYFSAFFKKVFDEDSSNDSLFQNPTTHQNWLHDTNIISQYRPSTYRTIEKYHRSSEPEGVLKGFSHDEILTPEGRSGKNHPQDVLELSWENEASYSLKLTADDLKNARYDEAEYIILSLANILPESQPSVNVTLESDDGKEIYEEFPIPEVVEIDNTIFFGLFDSFFRDGKYEKSWEPIFETIEIPLDEFQNFHQKGLDLTIKFNGDKGKVMLEEIGVY